MEKKTRPQDTYACIFRSFGICIKDECPSGAKPRELGMSAVLKQENECLQPMEGTQDEFKNCDGKQLIYRDYSKVGIVT